MGIVGSEKGGRNLFGNCDREKREKMVWKKWFGNCDREKREKLVWELRKVKKGEQMVWEL